MSTRIKAIVILVIHSLLALALLVPGSKLLEDSNNQKEGVFKVELGQNLFSRGFSIPTDDIPLQATDVVRGAGDLVKEVTTVVAQATDIAQDVQSKITSAIAAGETLLHGLVPEALTVGTTTGCVEYGGGRSDCMKFPISDDKTLDTIYNLSDEARPLVTQLKLLPSLQTLFIAGLACFVTTFAYSVINATLAIFRKTKSGLFWNILAYFIFITSICTCGLFSCFLAFVAIIHSSGRGLAKLTEGSFESGPALSVAIVSLVASASHLVCLVLGKIIGV